MSLTFIISVKNHWKTTAECLASIFKSDIPIPYKFIVIDDASDDFTPQFLKLLEKEGRQIIIITNITNLGYIKSNNKALRIVDTKYVVFLNNDIHLDKSCIKNLLEVYEKHPEVGILGATQYNSKWEELSPLKYFLRGEKATIRDHMVCTNIPENLKESEIVYCDDIHLACALTTKEIMDNIGLLDEDYGFGNYEQENLCCQILEMGKRVAISPKARFIHYVSISVMDNINYYSQLLDRNRKIFMEKWGQKLKDGKI